jgi:hypothetical protein
MMALQMRRSWLCCLFCLFAIWAFEGIVRGDGVKWQVSVGFDDTYKEGAWTPVFVDITNEGGSQTGRVIVPITYKSPSPERKINYAVPVDLPQHSKKRYMLYAPSEGLENVYLNLSGLREKKELPRLKEAGREDILVVVVGGDRGLLKFLTGTKAVSFAGRIEERITTYGQRPVRSPAQSESDEIQVGHADWNSLPESWLGWEGVDAVVLGDAGFAGASQGALEALLQWVELGGTLVAPGGSLSPSMAGSPINRLLPIEISGTTTLTGLEALSAWVGQPIERQPVLAGKGSLRPDAMVLCGTHEQPLIAIRNAGSGRVVMATFDYSAAPVKYWNGQTSMWPMLLARATPPASLVEAAEKGPSYGYGSWPSLAGAAGYFSEARLPPMWLIFGFLVAYIVVLVPVNYLVLKRLDRRELAWVTTPMIVVVFTLGAYAAGYGMRGGAVVLNRLGIVETEPGERLARGYGYVGLFSPARTTYDLLLEGTAAGARDLAQAEQRVTGQPTVLYGPKPMIGNVAMNMWTSRAFCIELLADLQKGVTGFVEYNGKELRAKVKNGTGFPLEKCRIVAHGSAGQEKDLAAGQEGELVYVAGTAARVLNTSISYPRNPGGPAKATSEELAIQAIFGEVPYGPPGTTIAPDKMAPHLVAITRQPLVPVKLAGKRPKVNDGNLIIVRLPVRLAGRKRIAVPSWLITRRLVESKGKVTQSRQDDSPGGFRIEGGNAVLEFRVPVSDKGAKADSLKLLVRPQDYYGPSGPKAPSNLQISAYNFRLNNWQTLPALSALSATPPQPSKAPPSGATGVTAPVPSYRTSGNIFVLPFPNAADFMTQDGRVQVKLGVATGTFELADVQLKGDVSTF